jgi:glycosyltransferase involved in cell wall biosynthesis
VEGYLTETIISVIMPVYNGERFIREAVDSVLAQTHAAWELLIVDDGSTDATPTILAHYHDPRIRVFRQENRGEGGARNTGLDHARGDIVALLDADDVYLPTALADFVARFAADPEVDVLYADGTYCDAELRPIMRMAEHRHGRHEGHILEPLVLAPNTVSVPSCMAVRRCTVDARPTRFDETLEYGVDWDFWIALARHARFGYLDRCTTRYRIHTSNMTRSSTVRRRKRQLAAGRLKILYGDWFAELSVATRARFLYNLLVDLLDGEGDAQRQVMESAPFQGLPAPQQAYLLRLVANEHIRLNGDLTLARWCLERAAGLWPADRKSRLVLGLLDASPAACRFALAARRQVHLAGKRLRSAGKRQPRPVPIGLAPGEY